MKQECIQHSAKIQHSTACIGFQNIMSRHVINSDIKFLTIAGNWHYIFEDWSLMIRLSAYRTTRRACSPEMLLLLLLLILLLPTSTALFTPEQSTTSNNRWQRSTSDNHVARCTLHVIGDWRMGRILIMSSYKLTTGSTECQYKQCLKCERTVMDGVHALLLRRNAVLPLICLVLDERSCTTFFTLLALNINKLRTIHRNIETLVVALYSTYHTIVNS